MLYPKLTKTRKLFNLDGMWKFKQGLHKSETPLSNTEMMTVPSSFNDIIVDKTKRNYIGDFWYEQIFEIPQVSSEEELVLHFGSVTHQAKVYVNGVFLGEHIGGFLPFEFAIPEKLYQNGVIRVSVCANNELTYATLPVGNYCEEIDENGHKIKRVIENFDFFNYAGIHRHVKLYTRPKVHIKDIVVTSILSEDYSSAEVSVEVKTSLAVTDVVITIFDEENRQVAQVEEGKATIKHPRLWNILDAYLYKVQIEIFDNGNLLDSYDEEFGIRKIEVKNGQFLINDKPFYFKGFGKHEDTYINGRGINEAANLMDLNLLKKIGANSFRTSHYPYSEEMMRLADRMGIVVIDEVPAVGLFKNFTAALDLLGENEIEKKSTWDIMKTHDAHKNVIRELVERDKNHPCVVMWVVANEPASHEEGAREYFEPLIKEYKELDPQRRPVTLVNIMHAKPQLDKISDLLDVICLNRYYGWYVHHGDLKKAAQGLKKELLEWQALYPNKPILMTEYGADTLPGLHSNWEIPYTEEYQCDYYDMNHQVFDTIENLVGEQVWNFADFETNVMLFRVKGNHKGLFSRNREPKGIVQKISKRWQMIPNYDYKK